MQDEFDLWREVDSRQKSYLVNVLHWFHYRPRRLRASWKQEEVLTWELLRALEVLPQDLFARPLLEKLASFGQAARRAVRYVLQAPVIEVTPYPSLGLRGGKRNCKSDIGLGHPATGPNIWLEAKTARFSTAKLREQLDQQSRAMASLMGEAPYVLATVLPGRCAMDDYPNLSWDAIVWALESCTSRLIDLIDDEDLRRGYIRIAEELVGRIQSHPNRADGWV